MELPTRARRSIGLFAALLLVAAPDAIAGIGRTPGFAAVTEDGEAAYTIPLDLPPGTNGMTPVVSLEYRHRTRNGLVGIGWSIGGLSQITRCRRTVAQDGNAFPKFIGAYDRFCLDGQRLVALDILAYGAPSGEYRTEIESFARIRAIPGSSSGPGHFVVEGADGRVYEYGATADSRIDRSAGATTANATVWALSRVRDRSGNVIDYVYTEDTANGSFRVASIRYNANPAAGVAASHQISFAYENRPSNEIDTGYVDGNPVREVVRLKRIDLLHDGAVLRRYDLRYEPALSSGGRSRLASIQECAGTGPGCLGATTFVWQNGTTGFAAAMAVTAAAPGPSTARDRWHFADINGDGRLDYLWAGGAAVSSATIRYRLGTATGFGPEVNTGIACPFGIGKPFDSNGDGRADLLMRTAASTFTIALGKATGLAAPVSTGVPIPAGLKDFRGLDLNADGLGDIAWSEAVGPSGFDVLYVRARYQLGAGGYQTTPVTLYSQAESTAYQEAKGGQFLWWRVELNGDGAEDLLMDEELSVARISIAGASTETFDGSAYNAGVVLDFNDDGCSDFAYKHRTSSLRVRVNSCGPGGSGGELLGPAWTGAAALGALDWNGDGRDDVLVAGPTNWLVALSYGGSLAPLVDTGIPHEGAQAAMGRDVDGDGLHDLVTRVGDQIRLRLRNGAPPDLLLSVKDGFGVSAEFAYAPLTDSAVYTRGTGAVHPDQDMQTSAQVVASLKTTDGGGRGWKKSIGFRYEGLRRNLQGRGSLGFRKRVHTDLVPERMVSTEVTRRQDFPFTGLPESIIVRQGSGKPITHANFQWSKLDLGGRRFPYTASATSRRYEVGGVHDGSEITRVVRSVAAIDSTSGRITDETTTVTEIASGVNAGSSASIRARIAGVLNDTSNWCLGRPQTIEVTASHTLASGVATTRSADQSWDGAKCRPTRRRIEPGDSLWQVTYDLGYDNFGNLATEKITGAGMTARTMTLDWGARGNRPVSVSNPLGQAIRFTWEDANGLPVSYTDPNGLKTRWIYDAFGEPTQETQADGTSTRWTAVGCKGGCDARSKYTLIQEELDSTGAVRARSDVEVDQNGRGWRLRTQMPGGGYSVSIIDRDDRGLQLRRYLPRWDGDLAGGYWYFTYDVLGRLAGAQLEGASGAERSMTLRYDGLAVTAGDSLGHAATSTRTAWGHIAQSVDAQGDTTRFEHDAFGNLARVRDALNNSVATVGYNTRGMKLTHTDMDMGVWTWTPNALGETTALRNAKGQVVRFEYDPLGRITKRIAPEGTDVWTWGKTASKKDIGRLIGVAGPGFSENITYDTLGRPATRTITTDTSYRYSYTYNALGLLDTLTYPAAGAGSAFAIRHDYDAGLLTAIRNANAPGEPFWTLNAVDPAGNPMHETLGGTVSVVNGFDPATGMLESRQSGVGTTSTIQNLAYGWDANGNLTRRTDLNQGISEAFRYDALDRLLDSRRNGVLNLELEYDAIGNIRRKSDVCTGTTKCYGYHATRKHAVVSAGAQKFAYDANGNMTKRGGAAIAWTSGNLPKSIAHSNGNNSKFSYGPDGNRWKQVAKHDTATETTLYAGELFEKVTRGGSTKWRHYVLTPTGPAAVHLRSSDGTAPAVRYLTRDHLGSIDRIVDASGKLVAAESFSPFGARRGSNWTGTPGAGELAKIAAVTRDGFTGHEHLDNVDLIHMNGRVYDPALGRFISADPYATLRHSGQGLNRYAYAFNDPLSYVDPSGFDPPPCLESSPGTCAQITVVGVEWADYIRYIEGGAGQIESARERDPCGQESDAMTCAMQGRRFVSPASIVLTVGDRPDPTLSRGRLDALQGAVAQIANITISSSPVALLFGADPDFEWFDVPDSAEGRGGATLGNAGYLVGGFAGAIRKGSQEIVGSASSFARSWQASKDLYSNIDRFKDIVLKKGTIIFAMYPGQGYFYTTRSALRRAGDSSSMLHRGLQIGPHSSKPPRTRYAAYEVLEDTKAAFSLAMANAKHGPGRLPQIVVPSFETSLRYLNDFPLGP